MPARTLLSKHVFPALNNGPAVNWRLLLALNKHNIDNVQT